jgi:acetyltransferase-like isoleucine patch superfamily enzyme
MNLHRSLRRLLGRPTCVLATAARLDASARILNARNSSDHIYVGSHSVIKGELFVFAHGGSIKVGEWCYVGEGSRIWSAASISIGNRVLISHNVNVFDSLTHPLSAAARHSQFRAIVTSAHPSAIDLGERPVTISDDVLVGAAATILRGTVIGRGAIVAAASVVTHDVEPFTIVAGNPARPVRALTEAERH